ncbi:hypothetical protein GN956_G8289 [Arapaima gigas]
MLIRSPASAARQEMGGGSRGVSYYSTRAKHQFAGHLVREEREEAVRCRPRPTQGTKSAARSCEIGRLTERARTPGGVLAMPVILGEIKVLTRPLSGVRMCELLTTCLAFSLEASLGSESLQQSPFKHFCTFTWCFFFVLTLLILLVDFIQFQSIIPLSWKNLPITVATLAALMCLTSSVGFGCVVLLDWHDTKAVATTVCSCLAFVVYSAEVHLIRLQGREQRGYMASTPGLLKVFQVFGGCVMLLLLSEHCYKLGTAALPTWQSRVSVGMKLLCFLMSLGTVLVMLGDCAGRCPLPFDRLLAGSCLLAVLIYMVVTVLCVTEILEKSITSMNLLDANAIPFIETIIACLILLTYTVDLAFSVKLLCDRA